ncbi:MAG: 5,10-methylenetetrahydrofolate reductase, partial [Deltaproteobacteria bacterium]|nr:5,10-methylenetetrahydrofolate reductase [Deltaproteobacteria bacterium]
MGLKDKLEAGEFAVLAEMEPPKGTDISALVANAVNVKEKVDAYVVPEMNSAVMRLSSLGGALLLQIKGLETVMQVCCRDRNRLALQGDLLAANALGVPNVMAVTGEDITHGDHH